jgi:hypothetical protein
MVSGGRTNQVTITDIDVGRKILCKEKPNTRPTSACAKQLIKTVKAAKRGLTAKQQKLWSKFVYVPAILQVFWDRGAFDSPLRTDPSYDPAKVILDSKYSLAIMKGRITFKDLYGRKHKWADYLLEGAKLIKRR